MKFTFELPAAIYRQVKARAALAGQSVKDFLLEAIQDKLAKKPNRAQQKSGWQAAFGISDANQIAEVQQIIDREFSRIEPENWQ